MRKKDDGENYDALERNKGKGIGSRYEGPVQLADKLHQRNQIEGFNLTAGKICSKCRGIKSLLGGTRKNGKFICRDCKA